MDEDAVKRKVEEMEEESRKDNLDVQSSGTADEWDLIDEESDHIQSDETLSRAAQLIGSALFGEEEIDHMESDETLARAAQLVGSALFEEDNSKSESFYSVPSENSDIPLAVMTRWYDELAKLRELGFVDDKKSVLCLEELQAANIGVDSDEPLEIERVVNRLLQKN